MYSAGNGLILSDGMSVFRSALKLRTGLLFMLGLLVLIESSAAVAASSDRLFYGGWYGDSIGSVSVDGSRSDPTLIQSSDPFDRFLAPTAMTIQGDFLYWESNSLPIRIGRSHLDGSDAQTTFIESRFGEVGDGGIAVSDGELYWEASVKTARGTFATVLNRSRLDGTAVEDQVAVLGHATGGPFVIKNDYAYFVAVSPSSSWDSISKVRIDGHHGRVPRLVSHRQIIGGSLVGRGRYLYWLEEGRQIYLARASLDGSELNTHFRTVPNRGCHAHSEITGAAISRRFIFLACESGRVDRLTLRGKPRIRQIVTHARLGGGGMVLAVAPS